MIQGLNPTADRTRPTPSVRGAIQGEDRKAVSVTATDVAMGLARRASSSRMWSATRLPYGENQ
jgi:hypothetical protein